MNPPDKMVGRNIFVFNKHDNGGEHLVLVTEVFYNGDPPPNNIYYNQKLTLHSYCNSATFALHGAAITSDSLRELADELDNLEKNARMQQPN